MKTLHIPCDPGEISDGFHTFNELYDHRCTLFLALMASNPDRSWLSAKHHDGEEWEGWFIAGMELPTGDVTYHLPNSMMGAAMQTGARVLDRGKEWDGHTAADVVTRLREWVSSANRGSGASPPCSPFVACGACGEKVLIDSEHDCPGAPFRCEDCGCAIPNSLAVMNEDGESFCTSCVSKYRANASVEAAKD